MLLFRHFAAGGTADYLNVYIFHLVAAETTAFQRRLDGGEKPVIVYVNMLSAGAVIEMHVVVPYCIELQYAALAHPPAVDSAICELFEYVVDGGG